MDFFQYLKKRLLLFHCIQPKLRTILKFIALVLVLVIFSNVHVSGQFNLEDSLKIYWSQNVSPSLQVKSLIKINVIEKVY